MSKIIIIIEDKDEGLNIDFSRDVNQVFDSNHLIPPETLAEQIGRAVWQFAMKKAEDICQSKDRLHLWRHR